MVTYRNYKLLPRIYHQLAFGTNTLWSWSSLSWSLVGFQKPGRLVLVQRHCDNAPSRFVDLFVRSLHVFIYLSKCIVYIQYNVLLKSALGQRIKISIYANSGNIYVEAFADMSTDVHCPNHQL